MRILICDDDPLMTEQLKKYITEYFSRNSLKCPELALYDSGEALLADPGDKDIVFLDVEMPGISGISTGERLKEENPNILIFIVTAFSEYLDDAMRFHVFRYLSKPIDKQRLFRNLRDALQQLYQASNSKIAIETRQGIQIVPASEIVCVEAKGRSVIIHTITADYPSIHTMPHWLDTLSGPSFFQTHRSFIVNLEHVTSFNHTMVFLCCDRVKAYLARRKYTQFKVAYLLYLESTN